MRNNLPVRFRLYTQLQAQYFDSVNLKLIQNYDLFRLSNSLLI